MEKEQELQEIRRYLWEEVDGYDLTWESDCDKLAEKLYEDGWRKQQKGVWLERRWTTEDDWGCINHRSIECSACKTEIYNGEPTEYCPHCGAEMQEKVERKYFNV